VKLQIKYTKLVITCMYVYLHLLDPHKKKKSYETINDVVYVMINLRLTDKKKVEKGHLGSLNFKIFH